MSGVRPADERPHQPDAGAGPWSESWWFDFATADGRLGGWVRFTRHPAAGGGGSAWYQAMLAGPDRQLLAVVDHDVPFRSNPMEIRTTGLWADHVCETPLDHWTLGLEAFALGVDDPLELYGRAWGDRVPLGFDLEWETDGPVVAVPDATPGVQAYDVACRVDGELLIGDEAHDLAAVGHRRHRWGPVDWAGEDGWTLTATHDGGRHWVATAVGDGVVVSGPDGAAERGSGAVDVDADGLPVAAHVEAGSLVVRAEVLAVTPLEVPAGDGRPGVRRPAALCRLRTGDGGIGVGWLELRGSGRGRLGA